MILGYDNSQTVLTPVHAHGNLLVLGNTGTGKSALLERLVLDAIHSGAAVVFLDPDGRTIDRVLARIPRSRYRDVLLVDPTIQPFALNVLAHPDRHFLLAQKILRSLKGLWDYDDRTPLIDLYTQTSVLTLLEAGGESLITLPFLLDAPYQDSVLGRIHDDFLKTFWDSHKRQTDKEQRQAISSTLNKAWSFTLDSRVRYCLDQRHSHLSLKDTIVLLSFRESELGENARFLGAITLAAIYVKAISGDRTNLFIDGSVFGTGIVTDLMRVLPTVITARNLDELGEKRSRFLSSVEQILALQISVADYEEIAPQFNMSPGSYKPYEIQFGKGVLARDGKPTELTMFLHEYPETGMRDAIVKRCKAQCSARPAEIEERLGRFFR